MPPSPPAGFTFSPLPPSGYTTSLDDTRLPLRSTAAFLNSLQSSAGLSESGIYPSVEDVVQRLRKVEEALKRTGHYEQIACQVDVHGSSSNVQVMNSDDNSKNDNSNGDGRGVQGTVTARWNIIEKGAGYLKTYAGVNPDLSDVSGGLMEVGVINKSSGEDGGSGSGNSSGNSGSDSNRNPGNVPTEISLTGGLRNALGYGETIVASLTGDGALQSALSGGNIKEWFQGTAPGPSIEIKAEKHSPFPSLGMIGLFGLIGIMKNGKNGQNGQNRQNRMKQPSPLQPPPPHNSLFFHTSLTGLLRSRTSHVFARGYTHETLNSLSLSSTIDTFKGLNGPQFTLELCRNEDRIIPEIRPKTTIPACSSEVLRECYGIGDEGRRRQGGGNFSIKGIFQTGRIQSSLFDHAENANANANAKKMQSTVRLSVEKVFSQMNVSGSSGGFTKATAKLVQDSLIGPAKLGLRSHLSLSMGGIFGLFGGTSPPGTGREDRFYLGGPCDLKGYQGGGCGGRRGVRPDDNGRTDAGGGEFCWWSTLGISGKLPGEITTKYQARWTTYAQAGCLGRTLQEVQDIGNTRVGIGAGIMVPAGGGRLEITTTKIIRIGTNGEMDRRYNGWFPQIGIQFEIG